MISSSFSAGFSFSENPIGDFWTLLEFDGGFSKLSVSSAVITFW